MTATNKKIMKQTGALGATFAIHVSAVVKGKSAIVSEVVSDFTNVEPVGSAFFYEF